MARKKLTEEEKKKKLTISINENMLFINQYLGVSEVEKKQNGVTPSALEKICLYVKRRC